MGDVVDGILAVTPHASFVEMSDLYSHAQGGRLDFAFRVGRATVEACVAYDVLGPRVVGSVIVLDRIRHPTTPDGIAAGCSLAMGPADAIASLEVSGGGKWGAEAETADEAVVVPLSVHGNRDAEGLEPFLRLAAANGAILHVAAAGSIDIQAHLAGNGFRWGEWRTDGYMTRGRPR